MTGERWTAAIHEAAHAVAAIELGGRVEGLVVTTHGTGGCTFDRLLADRAAFAVAAGSIAEHLAGQHTPPPVDAVEPVVELPAGASGRGFDFLSREANRQPGDRWTHPSDDQSLARWAIGGREDDPESWAGRVAFAKRVATQIVERNADRIVLVATELYRHGRLTEIDINNLLTNNPEGTT